MIWIVLQIVLKVSWTILNKLAIEIPSTSPTQWRKVKTSQLYQKTNHKRQKIKEHSKIRGQFESLLHVVRTMMSLLRAQVRVIVRNFGVRWVQIWAQCHRSQRPRG